MSRDKIALITGITGQDGAWLSHLLLSKGYAVHGIIRRSSSFSTGRIDDIYDKLSLHYGDLADSSSIRDIVKKVMPDEVYHLGAQSHVKVSFEIPEYTCDIDALGTLRLLDALREIKPDTRVYNAASSEMFGNSPAPQNEATPFWPRSPYACAKVFSFHISKNYREAYNMHISSGILFNHESSGRGETFLTRKVTRAATRIKLGLQKKLIIGNTNAKRDWGDSRDYVRAMWMMLQQKSPDDYIVATGESHTVSEFVHLVFKKLDLDHNEFVEIDPKYFRPAEVDHLQGDASKARKKLKWRPEISFEQMITDMIAFDYDLAEKEKLIRYAF
jgi:GDPmannose 4,6-dehydratase